jgi:hypothetical protein
VEVDDAEHALFVCMFWSLERRDLVLSLERHPCPEDVADLLCRPVVDELLFDNEMKTRIIAAAVRQKSSSLGWSRRSSAGRRSWRGKGNVLMQLDRTRITLVKL